jgi:hypothetical protein
MPSVRFLSVLLFGAAILMFPSLGKAERFTRAREGFAPTVIMRLTKARTEQGLRALSGEQPISLSVQAAPDASALYIAHDSTGRVLRSQRFDSSCRTRTMGSWLGLNSIVDLRPARRETRTERGRLVLLPEFPKESPQDFRLSQQYLAIAQIYLRGRGTALEYVFGAEEHHLLHAPAHSYLQVREQVAEVLLRRADRLPGADKGWALRQLVRRVRDKSATTKRWGFLRWDYAGASVTVGPTRGTIRTGLRLAFPWNGAPWQLTTRGGDVIEISGSEQPRYLHDSN